MGTAKLESCGKNDIFKYLSQNEPKAIYSEMESEGLMTMLRKLVHEKTLNEKDCLPKGQESQYRTLLRQYQAFAHNQSHLFNIWSCKHTVEMLVDLYQCGPT